MVVFRFGSELGLIGLETCLELLNLFMLRRFFKVYLEENGSSYDSTPFAKHIDCVSLFFLRLNLLFAVFIILQVFGLQISMTTCRLCPFARNAKLVVLIFELIFRAEPHGMYVINASCLSISHLSRMMEQEQLSHSCALAGLDGEKASENFSCSSRFQC